MPRNRLTFVIPALLSLGSLAGTSDRADRGEPMPSESPPDLERQAIDLEVRYPTRNQLIAPDSNFLFGSVGSGTATLEIEGQAVEVEPNGAFLAWLRVPEASRGDTAVYRIRVTEGADTVSVTYPVVRPPDGPPPGASSPWVSTLGGEHWYRPGDRVQFAVTGEAGASVHLEAGDGRFELTDLGVRRGTLHRYGAELDLERLHRSACGGGSCRTGRTGLGGGEGPQLDVAVDTVSATIVARLGDRETRTPAILRLVRFPDPAPRVRLLEATDAVNGQSGVVVGRPTPSGPYRWRFPAGAVATVRGVSRGGVDGRVALDLGAGQVAWVLAEDVVWAPGAADGPGRAFDGRARTTEVGADFRLGLSAPAITHVTTTGPRSLRLTVHNTFGEISRLAHGVGTGISRVDWSQSPGPRLHVDLEFEWPVWGHRLTIETGDAAAYEGPSESGPSGSGAVLRLAVRRPPAIEAGSPLRGIRVAVDPGHPGAGSYGPTGLYEGDANLAIARSLIEMLEAAGAEPVVIREDRGAVGLYERTGRARAANADLLVSIHNNALPDGVRPFDRAGTATFYYHGHSADLARAVQSGMVEQMGLEDRGVLWGDLAMVREPWMPAVLAEGAFMMIPAHEAALGTPEFRERYARGVLIGIESFLRSKAERP